MKKICLLIMVLAASFMLQAQNDTVRSSRLKVGVVLGGGGAKGASHIGVLKYIEEMGIPVDYVAGTSMGSILGGLYAMGYSPDEMTRLISNIDWSEYIGNKIDRSTMSQESRKRNSTTLLNVPFSLESIFDNDPNSKFINSLPSAFVNNSSLINLFNDLCVGYQEEMDFNDMPIPFACVATNIVTGDEVVLRNGNLPTAMRASMAIPGVFSPVAIGDMVLVDGGLVNNFPADVLKEMGADIIIGVEVTSEKKITRKDIQSLPQLLGRLVTNSTSGKREENRKLCNVRIVPDIQGFGMLSFTPEAIDTLVGRGYKKAQQYHDQLLAIKQQIDKAAGHPTSKHLHAHKALNLIDKSICIRSIEFNNISDKDSRWLMRKCGLKMGNKYNKDDIEKAISIYRGTGCYDEIIYTIKECDSIHSKTHVSDSYVLNINMTPAKPNVMGVGLRYDTEEGAALLFNLGLNEKKFKGSKFNASIKLSFSPRINLTYTYALPSVANFNLAYDYRNEHFGALVDKNNSINLRYQQQRVSGYVSQFHLLNFSTNLGLSYASFTYDASSVEGSVLDSSTFKNNRLLTPFVNMRYDNLDDAYFAKHGISARLTGRYHLDMTNPDSAYYWIKTNCWELSYTFQAYITPGNSKFTIIPQVYGRWVFNSPVYFNLCNTYGGEIEGRHFENQMPFIGFNTVESITDNSSVLRVDLRYNFYGKHYLTVMYNAMMAWDMLKLIQVIPDINILESQGAGLKYSYNSPLGPISLTTHWSRRFHENHFGVYFSFGYTF